MKQLFTTVQMEWEYGTLYEKCESTPFLTTNLRKTNDIHDQTTTCDINTP